MSGILKKIGKVFKKVIKSKIFKVVAIAAAVYFTGGIALGAMGSSFAATMPGIQAAASMMGITAGEFGVAGTMAAAGGAIAADTALMAGAEAGSPFIAGAGAVGDAVAGSGIINTAAPSLTSQVVNGASKLNTATSLIGGGTQSGASQPVDVYSKAKTEIPKAGSWTDGLFSNDNVAKAVFTFGSDALKGGVGLYAQKVAAEDKAAADKAAHDEYRSNQNIPKIGAVYPTYGAVIPQVGG